MKQIVLVNDEGQYNELLRAGLDYGWCNGIAQKFIEHQKFNANLVIVCPHEDPTYEKYYFFDVRDCFDDELNKFSREVLSQRFEQVVNMMEDAESILFQAIEHEEYFDDNVKYDRVDKLRSKLVKIYEEVEEIVSEIEDYEKSKK